MFFLVLLNPVSILLYNCKQLPFTYLIIIISRDTNGTPRCSLLNRLKPLRMKERRNLY